MLLQLPQLCIARIAIGIAGASINAQAGALFVSLAPSSRRGAYLLIMMIARGVGVAIGGGVGLLVIRLFLTDYTHGAHAAPSACAHARARVDSRALSTQCSSASPPPHRSCRSHSTFRAAAWTARAAALPIVAPPTPRPRRALRARHLRTPLASARARARAHRRFARPAPSISPGSPNCSAHASSACSSAAASSSPSEASGSAQSWRHSCRARLIGGRGVWRRAQPPQHTDPQHARGHACSSRSRRHSTEDSGNHDPLGRRRRARERRARAQSHPSAPGQHPHDQGARRTRHALDSLAPISVPRTGPARPRGRWVSSAT